MNAFTQGFTQQVTAFDATRFTATICPRDSNIPSCVTYSLGALIVEIHGKLKARAPEGTEGFKSPAPRGAGRAPEGGTTSPAPGRRASAVTASPAPPLGAAPEGAAPEGSGAEPEAASPPSAKPRGRKRRTHAQSCLAHCCHSSQILKPEILKLLSLAPRPLSQKGYGPSLILSI